MINHFKSKGYIFNKGGDKIIINSIDLPSNSGYKIKVKCDICGKIYVLTMQKYSKNIDRGGYLSCKSCNNVTYKNSMMLKYGVDNSSKCIESINKRKDTCLEKYNSEYICNSEFAKNKTIKTNLERYGGHPMKLDIIKNKSKNKRLEGYNKKEFINEWQEYAHKCRLKTNTFRKKMLELWNGYDYYDNEYIKDNFLLKSFDKLYPTIDHKISIFDGFYNNISIDNICDISNLCITKRKNNNAKYTKTEELFKDFLNKL